MRARNFNKKNTYFNQTKIISSTHYQLSIISNFRQRSEIEWAIRNYHIWNSWNPLILFMQNYSVTCTSQFMLGNTRSSNSKKSDTRNASIGLGEKQNGLIFELIFILFQWFWFYFMEVNICSEKWLKDVNDWTWIMRWRQTSASMTYGLNIFPILFASSRPSMLFIISFSASQQTLATIGIGLLMTEVDYWEWSTGRAHVHYLCSCSILTFCMTSKASCQNEILFFKRFFKHLKS